MSDCRRQPDGRFFDVFRGISGFCQIGQGHWFYCVFSCFRIADGSDYEFSALTVADDVGIVLKIRVFCLFEYDFGQSLWRSSVQLRLLQNRGKFQSVHWLPTNRSHNFAQDILWQIKAIWLVFFFAKSTDDPIDIQSLQFIGWLRKTADELHLVRFQEFT